MSTLPYLYVAALPAHKISAPAFDHVRDHRGRLIAYVALVATSSYYRDLKPLSHSILAATVAVLHECRIVLRAAGILGHFPYGHCRACRAAILTAHAHLDPEGRYECVCGAFLHTADPDLIWEQRCGTAMALATYELDDGDPAEAGAELARMIRRSMPEVLE